MSEAHLDNVRYEVDGGIAWITVDRPEKLNALNRRTVEEISTACERAQSDPTVRVLVLGGAGEKAFVAGADIQEMASLSPAAAEEYSHFLQASFDRLERSPKPVIAAVNGFALGGGCELALSCHLRFAAARARFGQPEVGLGLIPGAGGTQRLPRLVGPGPALELILSGEMIDATEAHRIGLVHRVFPDAELKESVARYAAGLMRRSPIALTRALAAVQAAGQSSQTEGMRQEASLFGLCFATDDMHEGTRAFLEKREPSFSGR